MHPVYFLTAAYFLVGAAATLRINRRAAGPERRERWTKYGVYFLVVHLVIAAILAGATPFAWVAAAVIAAGLGELVLVTARVTGSHPAVRSVALAVFAPLAFGFIQFARQSYSTRALFVYVVVLAFDGFSGSHG